MEYYYSTVTYEGGDYVYTANYGSVPQYEFDYAALTQSVNAMTSSVEKMNKMANESVNNAVASAMSGSSHAIENACYIATTVNAGQAAKDATLAFAGIDLAQGYGTAGKVVSGAGKVVGGVGAVAGPKWVLPIQRIRFKHW